MYTIYILYETWHAQFSIISFDKSNFKAHIKYIRSFIYIGKWILFSIEINVKVINNSNDEHYIDKKP